MSSRYEKRGVSASKEEVHQAIKNLDKGLYPRAFCKILPDIASHDSDFCNIMHADTAGTKTSLAYLYWQQTQKKSIWHGIAQDAIVMNVDDMACVGCIDNIILSSTIGRNKHIIPASIIEAIIQAADHFIHKMKEYDINIHLAGGETADVGDIVRSIDVGYTTFARLPTSDLVINDIRPGQVIIGLASSGQSSYEERYNSGIGSNGLTSARHDLLKKEYANIKASYSPETDQEYVYTGSYDLEDKIDVEGYGPFELGELILSPTRTYLPVIKTILEKHRENIHGLIHCTGGAQSKVLKFINDNVEVVKSHLLPIPPIFQLIQKESEADWAEMFQVFNMGHRMEVYTDKIAVDSILKIAESFAIAAQVIGEVKVGEKKVRIEHLGEEIVYQ